MIGIANRGRSEVKRDRYPSGSAPRRADQGENESESTGTVAVWEELLQWSCVSGKIGSYYTRRCGRNH